MSVAIVAYTVAKYPQHTPHQLGLAGERTPAQVVTAAVKLQDLVCIEFVDGTTGVVVDDVYTSEEHWRQKLARAVRRAAQR